MARKSTTSGFLVVIGVLALAGGCMRLLGIGDDGTEKEARVAAASTPAPVPSLIGKTLVDAENQTEALGFDLSTTGIGAGGYCGDDTDCFIYRMTPKPGTIVRPGGEVAVKFVTGAEWAWYRKHRKMPRVVGWSEEKADKVFGAVSDAVTSTTKETTAVPVDRNRVLGQSPKPGQRLRVGQEIKLIVGVNYGPGSTGDTDIDVDNGNDGESWFCKRRKWC
jgi:beta-lactam-binding protein with PASTA domain